MRTLALGLTVLFATTVAAQQSKKQPWTPGQPYQNPYYRPKPPPPPPWRPPAPDMCGPGYYCDGACGMIYGPNYCVRPCFPPFNGLLPLPGKKPTTPEEYQALMRQQQELLARAAAPRRRGQAPSFPPLPGVAGYPNLRPGIAPPGPYSPPPAAPPPPPSYFQGPPGIATFPVAPFVRSPRDFFMVGDP